MDSCLILRKNRFLHLHCFIILFFAVISFSCTTETTTDILSSEERIWLTNHDSKILIDQPIDNWAPIEGIDKNGNPFGIAIDYYKLIEKKLGFRFKEDKPRTWQERIKRYKEKKIDVMNNMQKNPERSEYLLFTEPYIEIHNVIIVRKEINRSLTLNQMTKMKISIAKDYAIHEYLRANYSNLTLEPVDNALTALRHVSLKRTDAAVMNAAVASYLIEKNHISNLRIVGQTSYTNALCIASRKDWPILNSILMKGLLLITPEERKMIREKWIHLDWVPFYEKTSFRIIAAFIIIIFLMNFFWNTRLRKEVHERKRAEATLSKSEKQYRYLFQNMTEAFALCELLYDSKGVPVDFEYRNINNRFESVLNKKRDDVVGKKFTEVFPGIEQDTTKWLSIFSEVVRTGQSINFESYSEIVENWFYITAYKIGDNQFAIVFMDISPMKEKEKLAGVIELSGAVCHELSQPLQAISGYSDLLLMGATEKDPGFIKLKKMNTEIKRMGTLIQKLSSITRYETMDFPQGKIIDIKKSSE